mmetsp:Transcript_13650/g.23239  ORF Transcript_13650/g.23239 Transcript_13650/m.23239 type:complete len:150 (-) Transcript_13650:2287-2736(-)
METLNSAIPTPQQAYQSFVHENQGQSMSQVGYNSDILQTFDKSRTAIKTKKERGKVLITSGGLSLQGINSSKNNSHFQGNYFEEAQGDTAQSGYSLEQRKRCTSQNLQEPKKQSGYGAKTRLLVQCGESQAAYAGEEAAQIKKLSQHKL